jgi:hypothetical protein
MMLLVHINFFLVELPMYPLSAGKLCVVKSCKQSCVLPFLFSELLHWIFVARYALLEPARFSSEVEFG